jgi:hypothetical protein
LGNDAGYLGAALKAWLALGVPQSDLRWRGGGKLPDAGEREVKEVRD